MTIFLRRQRRRIVRERHRKREETTKHDGRDDGRRESVILGSTSCSRKYVFIFNICPYYPSFCPFLFSQVEPNQSSKMFFYSRCLVVPTTQCSKKILKCLEKCLISVVFICPYHNRPHLFLSPAPKLKKYFYFLPIFLLKGNYSLPKVFAHQCIIHRPDNCSKEK
jgi:hypothetical protein